MSDVIEDIVKGAAMGSVIPGPGTALGAVGGLVMGLAPSLSGWLFGKGGAATATKTVSDVQAALSAVTGTSDASAQMALLAKDPEAAANLQMQLATIAAAREKEAHDADQATLAAQLADVANARQQTVTLAAAHSPIAYGAPVISLAVLTAFGVCMWLAFTRPPSDASRSIIDQLVGTLGAMSMAVVSYWVGTNAGSQAKTAALAASVPPEFAKQALASASASSSGN